MPVLETSKNAVSPSPQNFLLLLFILPLFNSVSAAALGALVVFSDADTYKFLAGLLSAANVGGWFWWIAASWQQLRTNVTKWAAHPQPYHPGYRLANLMSLSAAICWLGVLGLLAYGMLA